MPLYDFLKHAMGFAAQASPAPAMAQITIISTKTSVKRSSGSRSPRAQG